MAYKRPAPVNCRLNNADRALLIEAARAEGMSMSGFLKRALMPLVYEVRQRYALADNSAVQNVISRPVLAPANRAVEEAPSSVTKRSGFMEKMK
jgi:uncharacterized protein (DUF1778 family)